MRYLLVLNNNRGKLTSKLDLEYLFDYLLEFPDTVSINMLEIMGKNEEYLTKLFLRKFGKLPENIIFNENLTRIDKIGIPSSIKINIIMDNIHNKGTIKTRRLANLKKVSRIISPSAYCFWKHLLTTVPIYLFPRAWVFPCEINPNPINKILVSGRLRKKLYPFRQKMYEISRTHPGVIYLPVNFGYVIKKDSPRYIYGEKYIKELNKYLICFTCDACVVRPYIVAKHFEIMSAGSLLLAGNPNTRPYFEKLGFVDGVHYIAVTPTNIMEKINYVLDPANRVVIDRIRKNGYEMVRSKHFYKYRATLLRKILESDPLNPSNTSDFIKETDGIAKTIYYRENYQLAEEPGVEPIINPAVKLGVESDAELSVDSGVDPAVELSVEPAVDSIVDPVVELSVEAAVKPDIDTASIPIDATIRIQENMTKNTNTIVLANIITENHK